MIVIDDIVVAVVGVLLVEGVFNGIEWISQKIRQSNLRKTCAEFLVAPELTTEDHEMIKKLNEMLLEEFPDGVEARFKDMDIVQRQKLVKGIILELQKTLGIDIANVNFMDSSEIGYGVLGYFNHVTHNISINIDAIASNDPRVLVEMIDTLVHECRHAYQFKAITDSSKTIGSETQRRLWALNWCQYISPSVDFALYSEQIVEADARIFAEMVLGSLKTGVNASTNA